MQLSRKSGLHTHPDQALEFIDCARPVLLGSWVRRLELIVAKLHLVCWMCHWLSHLFTLISLISVSGLEPVLFSNVRCSNQQIIIPCLAKDHHAMSSQRGKINAMQVAIASEETSQTTSQSSPGHCHTRAREERERDPQGLVLPQLACMTCLRVGMWVLMLIQQLQRKCIISSLWMRAVVDARSPQVGMQIGGGPLVHHRAIESVRKEAIDRHDSALALDPLQSRSFGISLACVGIIWRRPPNTRASCQIVRSRRFVISTALRPFR